MSTNVIEEGLDVRSCNLVIKFDFPSTFRLENFQTNQLCVRSYVQSKGRARAKPSRYLLMVGTRERDHREAKVCEFRAIEKLALKECHQREDNEDQVNKFVLEMYLPLPGASQWL